MPQTDELFHAGHRERLREKFLDKKITEAEQLELLLGYAIPRRDVRPLARKLIQKFGSVYQVIIAPMDELMAVPGVGRSVAILIKLVCSLLTISHVHKLKSQSIFTNHQAVEDFCRMQMANKATEEVHVLYLNGNFCLVDYEVHSQGGLTSSNIYFEKIMARALKNGIKSLVLLHNHPTTDNTFSQEDVTLTEDFEKLLNMCNLTLYDHFVVSGGIVHSMRAENLLNKSIFKK